MLHLLSRLSFTILASLILISCGSSGRDPVTQIHEADGNVFYGGTFQVNEVESFSSLSPLGVNEESGFRIKSQIFEGLTRLNQKSLMVEPSLAEKWDVDSTGTIYTFQLRQGVNFHDNACFSDGKGRELTSADFKYCFDRLCSADANNHGFEVFKGRVQGADDYYAATQAGTASDSGVAGVIVIDDYTLQIRLTKAFPSFLSMLSMMFTTVYPEEAVTHFGDDLRVNAVGTGPFMVKEVKENEYTLLARNEQYWRNDNHGNQLPYLDGIKVSFIKEKKSEFLEFRKGNLDMVYEVPLEMTEEVFAGANELNSDYKKFKMQSAPALSLQFYGFLHTDEVFSNKAVRQAFNYAIDRRQIVDFTLQGIGIQAVYGTVPPALIGYDSKAIKGYEFNADKARQLMADAGFPNGSGFPEVTLQINSGGGRNEFIAEAVQKMLNENLNITVNVSPVPFSQHIDDFESGKVNFFRLAWVGDYPDPEGFLKLYYGANVPEDPNEKAYLNFFRYNNPTYDSLYNLALDAVNEDERNLLFLQADQFAIDDAVIMPIYYERIFRLLQPYVRNFPQNPMEYRDFGQVFFAPKTHVEDTGIRVGEEGDEDEAVQ